MAKIKNELIEKVFYKLTLFIQPPNSDEDSRIDISSTISGMVILKKFNTYSMPAIRVISSLSLEQVRNLQANFNKGSAFLSLEKFVQQRNGKDSKPEDMYDPIYTDVPLTIVGLDRTEVNTAQENNNDNELHASEISFPIELVPSDSLRMNEQVTPQILGKTNTLNILAKVISDNFSPVNPFYRVCLAEPDISREFPTFNIPCKSLYQFGKYMQQVYGVYNSPVISFFDIDRYYLMASGALAKFPKDKPIDLTNCDETHISFVSDAADQLAYIEGSYYDDEYKVARGVAYLQPRVSLADPAQKYLDGDHVKLMSGSFSEREMHECFMIDIGGDDNGIGREKIAISRFDNPTIVEQFKFTAKENYAPIQININNVDIRMFDPRKKFLFINDSDEQTVAEGYWRIVETQFTFSGTGGLEDNLLSLNVKAGFKPYLGSL